MKVLLIVPPLNSFTGIKSTTFHLGIGYIASTLKQAGHEAVIYDPNIITNTNKKEYSLDDLSKLSEMALLDSNNAVWKELESVVSSTRPDVVGISSKIPDLRITLNVLRIVKGIDNKTVTVVGGPAGTTCPDLVLRDPKVDFVVRGEGEITIVELLEIIKLANNDFEKIDGLSFRSNDVVIHNKNRSLIENIDELPFPDRESLLFSEQRSLTDRQEIMSHLVTSRGCPYLCTYCANTAIWGTRNIRLRTPESVVEEIIHLRDTYGVSRVTLWDDHLTTNKKRVVDFCNLLINENVGVKWLSFARANTIDSELLNLMEKAGCYELQIGVESGSDRILTMVNKGVTLDQMRNAAKLLRKSGIRWHCFLMIGFPTETRDEMQATIEFLYQLKPDSVQLSVVTPYPGTKLFMDVIATGKLTEEDWLSADTERLNSVLVDTMSSDAFCKLAGDLKQKCDKYNAVQSNRFSKTIFFIKHWMGQCLS